ncbi:putative Carbonic anhydrase [Venustampulla echinocandica]|uniref:Carbonic anhydrase n=1 Tax=Venustampulla echinocandica TaxID=2656787 RepID=A0A370TV53_9HELO|nr:putative Carbonic anhydrase [Venustampulla echinocandica]RDL39413.1 putative Carbonic anhydrase [Venustampulla echinocandica]
MKSSTSYLVLFVNLFVQSATASCGHGTSLHKRTVTTNGLVKRVEVGKFGYIGTQGPANWQNLAPENVQCANGSNQSPINITPESSTLVEPGSLTINIPAVEAAEFENLGTTIEVLMEGKNASSVIGGKSFSLKQFHFHSPSEHTIAGEHFPLEMHMVHEAEDKSIAVLTVLFQLCEANGGNPVINALLPSIEAIRAPGSVTETGPIDFAPLITALNAQPMRMYQGSLTTPPCTEGPSFVITTQTLPLDIKAYNMFKSVVGFNSRFLQTSIGEPNVLAAK